MKIGSRIHIPGELVEEILLLLPVKSVLRFRCVSKPWKSLIGSKRFIDKQLKSSTKTRGFRNHRVIISQCSVRMSRTQRVAKALKQYNLQSLLIDSTIVAYDPDPTYTNGPGSIVGCCNGLICMDDDFIGCVFLWNPATRISKKLPIIPNERNHSIRYVGFGWDESSGAYKVFATAFAIRDLDVSIPIWDLFEYKVYSSKTNSWTTLDQGKVSTNVKVCISRCKTAGTFACGKLHWAELYGGGIVSFDLKSEEFGKIDPPPYLHAEDELWLGEIEGCLGAVCHSVSDDPTNKSKTSLDVWVMKEDKSWFKLATIPSDYHQPAPILPFTLFEDGGELSLLSGTTSFTDDSDDGSFITRKASVYVESLVSPPEMDSGTGRDWRWLLPHLTNFGIITFMLNIVAYISVKYFMNL